MATQIENIAWWILLLPLLSAVGITLFTLRFHKLSAQISIAAVSVSFLLSLLLFVALPGSAFSVSASWIHVADLSIDFRLILDPLSKLMLLVVTGVGMLIHIYSYGYLHDDRSLSRYFASLSLFTFSMLGIVLASNFVMMFIFWELVGVSSYLLIGFWYEKASAADACKKAFLTNRVGDFGFILGILVVWAALGSLEFDQLKAVLAAHPGKLGAMAGVGGLLVFCGAMGKSAQFPLHVWLPDAMEGPTPVSALIHAATMVAAGVYMLCRTFFLFQATPAWPEALAFLHGWTALDIIAWIGGATALMAALMAVQQDDIKRILAYSTLSQLGYMVMAVGLSGPSPAMYHLTTHAFFKAMLFLGAGSVIHACHHEQNIWRMGGLFRKMPITSWTFLLGALALCGVQPLSGFYSKDAILAQAMEHSLPLFGLAMGVAGLTTFYMFRLVFVAFFGKERGEQAAHAHESPGIMTWPLRALAFFTVASGVMGIDHFIAGAFAAGGHEAASLSFAEALMAPFAHSPAAAFLGLFATMLGLSAAWACYGAADADPLPQRFGSIAQTMRHRFYFDEMYEEAIRLTHDAIASVADWIDRWLISGLLVRGAHGSFEVFGRFLRLLQSGNLQTYAFLLVAGLLAIIYLSFSH
ncbi:MAG: NADH-quinone oxidoreductase subunit L [Verrucomicrobia bacterium]|nr:NADH-quinone oxidoreductase subunit L [Verrucomicrobiota bacterium]